MIKFFRKIRQKMLVENRFNKYLVYAIGEIILVVIGILIALQINNWNENRKDKLQVRKYYKQLLKELELDVNTIKFSIARLENDRKHFKSIADKLTESITSIDTILKVYSNADFIVENTTFKTKTINVLLTTGDIKLINSKIKNALLALQDEQQDHLFDSGNRFKFYTEIVSELTYTSPLNKTLWDSQETLSQTLNIKDKMIKEIPLVHKALMSRNSLNKADLIELNNILNLSKELQNFIKVELENL